MWRSGVGGSIPGRGYSPVQRSWGRTGPGMLEEQPGGPCVWNRVSEAERGRWGEQGGDRAGSAGPCGWQGGLGFLP